MTEIREFKIDVPKSSIDDLKTRLKLTRFPDKETPNDWSQGIPLAYVQEIRDYWLNEYDWPARQTLLKSYRGWRDCTRPDSGSVKPKPKLNRSAFHSRTNC